MELPKYGILPVRKYLIALYFRSRRAALAWESTEGQTVGCVSRWPRGALKFHLSRTEAALRGPLQKFGARPSRHTSVLPPLCHEQLFHKQREER